MDCSICLTDLVRSPIDVTPCGHPFHRHCLLQSLEFKKQCPLCKQHILESQCHPLYLSASRTSMSEDLTQGPDVEELKETINRLERERKELLEFKKKAKAKLKEQETSHETMMTELKKLANSFKFQEENRKAAEAMVIELQGKLAQQRQELEQQRTVVQLHNIRHIGMEIPEDMSSLTSHQKEEFIRNQKQLLTWANRDIQDFQNEKKGLVRQRDALEAQVASLTRKLSRATAQQEKNKRAHDMTNGASAHHLPTQQSPVKRLRTSTDASQELSHTDVRESSSSSLVPLTSVAEGAITQSDSSTTAEGNDHSFVEVIDSSFEDDGLPSSSFPTFTAIIPQTSAPPPTIPSTMVRRHRSFLEGINPPAPLPFGLSASARPTFSCTHPLPAPTGRNYQPTLKSLLKKL